MEFVAQLDPITLRSAALRVGVVLCAVAILVLLFLNIWRHRHVVKEKGKRRIVIFGLLSVPELVVVGISPFVLGNAIAPIRVQLLALRSVDTLRQCYVIKTGAVVDGGQDSFSTGKSQPMQTALPPPTRAEIVDDMMISYLIRIHTDGDLFYWAECRAVRCGSFWWFGYYHFNLHYLGVKREPWSDVEIEANSGIPANSAANSGANSGRIPGTPQNGANLSLKP